MDSVLSQTNYSQDLSIMQQTNNILKYSLSFLIIFFSLSVISCSTVQILGDPLIEQNKDFLQPNPEAAEIFRVLIVSDKYVYSQMKSMESIKRTDDPEGDEKTCGELKQYDKIDEVCEGTLSVWLFPDSGKLMKIRPKELVPIAEINGLIVEDIQRWDFEFPGETIEPNTFDIKYRVILRKIQSDEETMKEVREKVKEETEKKEAREKYRNSNEE